MGDAALNHPVVAAGGGGDVANSSPATTGGGGFVALDVGALSSLAGDAGPPGTPTAPPRTPKVMRSLSRKGDRKPAPADADANATAGGGSERPQLFVHVAAGDLGDAPGSARLVVHTPLAGTPGSKSRRFGRRPGPAPWLDPRRVVFLFATLSSVGTLILLYFTLSMSRADTSSGGSGGASDAR